MPIHVSSRTAIPLEPRRAIFAKYGPCMDHISLYAKVWMRHSHVKKKDSNGDVIHFDFYMWKNSVPEENLKTTKKIYFILLM